ncbi:MAG: amidohydrolase [Deltaproteobacteria bacterium]|nr:MAG: amidohydrolase [Deltaproteobacteria bacterium]
MAKFTLEKIFINGTIITMDKNFSLKKALGLNGRYIYATGEKEELLAHCKKNTQIIDLQGRTVLPGFIDPHSHFMRTGLYDTFVVNLASPPVGKITTIDEIINKLRESAKNVPENSWIFGYMYDDTLLKEQRHPTAKDLDRSSFQHPIFIRHVSGHLAALNTRALDILHINRDTSSPLGGRICKDDSGNPTGLLQGEPAMHIAEERLPQWTSKHWLKGVERASSIYAAKGVTTAQEGDAYPGDYELLLRANAKNLLKPRIQIFPNWNFPEELKKYPSSRRGTALTEDYMLSLGAVKLYQDGSIQGYSGYLSQPYYKYLPGTETGSTGEPRHPPEIFDNILEEAQKQGWQIAVHANGDQAIEEVINGLEKAQKKSPREDNRHIIIHCQTVREDQMDRMQQLGIIPSFFATHIYFWGDRHKQIFLGPERAERISPCKSAVDRGMIFTCHNDTYITPIDPLLSVWTAVTRQTYGGNCLGGELKIPIEDALRSVTSHAAYQCGEEAIKGSLEAGKLADLVILEENPLDISPEKIKDIAISETIRGGENIF